MKQAQVPFPTVHSEGRSGGSHPGPGTVARQREKRAHTTGITGQVWPAIALLGILIARSSFGFDDRLPVLSVGINLQLPDIVLLGLLGWIAAQRWVVPGSKIVRTPLDLPLLFFYGVTLFSTFVAVVRSGVDRSDAIASIRTFSYYLTFFAVTNLVRERRQLNFLLNGMFLLATIVAVAMIGQYLLGGSVQFFISQVGAGAEAFDASQGRRVAPPGFSIVLVSFVTSLCILVLEKFHPKALLRCLQFGLLGTASLVTFFRSYWVALIVVMLLMGCLVRGAERRRLMAWGLSGLAVMFTAVLVAYAVFVSAPESRVSRLVEDSWERYSTLVSGGTFRGEDPSVDFRKIEASHAVVAIGSRPVIGLGLGAAYRPWDPRLDWRDADGLHDLRRLIHNSHLGILLQSGLLGYLSMLWLSLAFLVRGFSNWRSVPDNRLRSVMLGFTLVFLALLIAGGANSLFMQSYWIPVIGMILGINEVILGKVRPR
jgi:hypothetical protein